MLPHDHFHLFTTLLIQDSVLTKYPFLKASNQDHLWKPESCWMTPGPTQQAVCNQNISIQSPCYLFLSNDLKFERTICPPRLSLILAANGCRCSRQAAPSSKGDDVGLRCPRRDLTMASYRGMNSSHLWRDKNNFNLDSTAPAFWAVASHSSVHLKCS